MTVVRRGALPIGLMLAGSLIALAWMRAGLGWHDEGLMLQWGARIGERQWPYRDFWSNYLPGQAVVQSVLGDSLIAWRVVRALTGAAAAFVVFLLVDRSADNRRWAFGAWAAAALTLSWPLTPGPTASATLLALLALLAVPKRPVLFGLLAGLAAVFRPELGLAALVAGLLQLHGDRPSRLRAAGTTVATVVVVLTPFLVAAGGDLIDQVFGFARIQGLQRLPLVFDPGTTDPNKVLERLLPVLLLGAGALWSVLALQSGQERAWLPLVVVGAAYLAARADEFHVVPLSVFLALVAGITGARASTRGPRVVAVAVLLVIAGAGITRTVGRAGDARGLTTVPLASAGGVRTDAATARALTDLQREVDRHTTSGDPILVLPPRTDRVRFGAPLLYTLLDRTNPTRYDVMQPGVVTTREVQTEIVRDLARSRSKLVIRWLAPAAGVPEDNGSGRSSGVTLLDDVVRARYTEVARFGDFSVLAKR